MSSPSKHLEENLRGANARLGLLLDSLDAKAKDRPAATPQQMAGLLSELMRAGKWLGELPAEKSPTLEREMNEYQARVERLRRILPAIHHLLLRDRARLEQERARVQSAAAWARSSRQTL